MNLPGLPDLRATVNPLGLAVTDDKTDLDNAQFLAAVQRAAAALRGRGVSAGDVVAIMLPNTAGFVSSLFAAWRLGAAVKPINPSLRSAEVSYQVSDAGAKVLIADTRPEFDAGAPVVETDELDTGRPPPGVDAPHERDDALALLIYTSGTNGSAQGCDARPRQPRCDVHRGDRRVQADPRRSQPADPAAVPRQRNRGRDAVTAAGRGPGDRGGPVQDGVVLRPDRTAPRHILLRRTNHLHDAVRPARQRETGHLVGALRHLRGGAGQCRTARGVRIPLRHPAHRGLRAVGGILRARSIRSAASASRARWDFRCRTRRSASSTAPDVRCPTVRPARW
ncbi:MAG: long-chain acyl-CoA synthetase [Mycobacterium sp.]|jgi:hypothetical protein